MIGTLLIGSLALQTVLVIGGPQDGKKATYDPILHVSHVRRAPAKKGVQVRRKSTSQKKRAKQEESMPRSGVRILDASGARRDRATGTSRVRSLDVAWIRTSSQLAQDLTTAKERQIVLPILRHIEKADWHLARGAHQGRTDLRAQAELGLAIQAYESANKLVMTALRREQKESGLGRKLARVQSLADQGTIRTCIALTRLQLKNCAHKGAERWILKASNLAPTQPEVIVLKATIDRLLGKR